MLLTIMDRGSISSCYIVTKSTNRILQDGFETNLSAAYILICGFGLGFYELRLNVI